MENYISLCLIQNFSSVESFLKEELGLSKNQIKKSNLKKSFLNRSASRGDKLDLPVNLINHLKIKQSYSGEEVSFIGEDNRFLIFSKPANTHMHPLRYSDTNTLLNWIMISEHSSYLKINEKSYDRGLLYRLDFETSGLVLYAKSSDIYTQFRESFNDEITEKVYLAICKGKVSEQVLKDKISYRFKKQSSGFVSENGDFPAFIKIELLDYNQDEDLSLVKVYLAEGLRHQIRIQLSNIGHPILGDTLYRGRRANRLYLHCYQYKIGEEVYSDKGLLEFRNFFNFNG